MSGGSIVFTDTESTDDAHFYANDILKCGGQPTSFSFNKATHECTIHFEAEDISKFHQRFMLRESNQFVKGHRKWLLS
jgi:hypothetical protein